MKKILILFITFAFCLAFSGCLSKSTKAPNIYELDTNSCGKNALKIDIIISTSALQTRSIFIKENNELMPLNDAKFISFAEDMMEKALVKYFTCNEPNSNSKSLDVRLLELYATKDEAVLSIQVQIDKEQKLISARTHTGDLEANTVLTAMNTSLEKVLAQIDNFATELVLKNSNALKNSNKVQK